MKIRIARICFPVHTLGPGDRVGIWVSGCSRACSGCISPDFQNPSYGREMELDKLIDYFWKKKEKISGFTISGGEPFEQKDALAEMMERIAEISEDIILFTGYSYRELCDTNDSSIKRVLNKTGMLVDGPYIEELNDGCGMRGSVNQQFILLNYNYEHPERWERKIQVMMVQDKVISIGIPGETK